MDFFPTKYVLLGGGGSMIITKYKFMTSHTDRTCNVLVIRNYISLQLLHYNLQVVTV